MYDLCTTYVRHMYDKGLRTHLHSGHCPYAPISTSQSHSSDCRAIVINARGSRFESHHIQ